MVSPVSSRPTAAASTTATISGRMLAYSPVSSDTTSTGGNGRPRATTAVAGDPPAAAGTPQEAGDHHDDADHPGVPEPVLGEVKRSTQGADEQPRPGHQVQPVLPPSPCSHGDPSLRSQRD